MKPYPNSRSRAVCEQCRIRCLKMYTDEFGGRTTYVICPICGNGDPQMDLDDCNMTVDELEQNFRDFIW